MAPLTFGGWLSSAGRASWRFALDAVRALLDFSENDGQGARAELRELAESHLAQVRAKIASLQAMERTLADAVRCCAAGETPGCPIIDALSTS